MEFLNVHTREKQYLSLMYIMYTHASSNIPSYTHVSSYVVWGVHPQLLRGWNLDKSMPSPPGTYSKQPRA